MLVQYKLVLLGIRCYRVSKGLVCLYILEKVEIWSGVTDASLKDRQTTEYSATQLVSSIKIKLSHAILNVLRLYLIVGICPTPPVKLALKKIIMCSLKKRLSRVH